MEILSALGCFRWQKSKCWWRIGGIFIYLFVIYYFYEFYLSAVINAHAKRVGKPPSVFPLPLLLPSGLNEENVNTDCEAIGFSYYSMH